MTTRTHRATELRMIAIDDIAVLNPRERNRRVFAEIVGNIKLLGLKKPITVTPRDDLPDGKRFLLICGEGRLKAYQSLGERDIAALVVQVNNEDAFIMSLTENIARRAYRPLELLAGIAQLREQGCSPRVIAEKIGLSADYVKDILTLLKHGEERLLVAVERGRVPLSVATTIVGAGSDESVQTALQEAYESGQLRGAQLLHARRVLAQRSQLGKSLSRRPAHQRTAVTASSVVRSYRHEVERQKLLVRKAELTQRRLRFVTEALRQLLADEHFANLLRAERLDTLPKQLAERVWGADSVAKDA